MSDKKNARPGSVMATFLCCVLGVPTCVKLLPGLYAADMMSAVAVGVLLGAAYLALRPILRVVTFPVGCLTFGLFNAVIDVALLYGCAALIEGFAIESVIAAVGTALLIGLLSGIVGGFK